MVVVISVNIGRGIRVYTQFHVYVIDFRIAFRFHAVIAPSEGHQSVFMDFFVLTLVPCL